MATWPYNLKDEEVTLEAMKIELRPLGLVDAADWFDEDRSDAPYQLHALIDHVAKGPGHTDDDAIIARVIRTAVALERKLAPQDETFTIALALEVAMVWEFG